MGYLYAPQGLCYTGYPIMAKKKDMLQEAMEAGQRGDAERARNLLQKLIKEDDEEAIYWLLMSTVVESREERIDCLKQVLAIEPTNSAAIQDLRLLGVALPSKQSSNGKGKEAKKDKKQGRQSQPLVKEARPRQEGGWSAGQIVGGLALILLGYIAASGGTFGATVLEGAEAESVDLLSSQESSAAPVALGPGDFLEEALTPTALYVNTPHPESSSFTRGLLAFEAGNWAEAAVQFENHNSSEFTSADGSYYLGLSYFELGEIELAEEAFGASIAMNPRFAPAYVGRAQSAMRIAPESSLAINDLNTAILLDANFVDAYLKRASYFLAEGERELALNDLNQAELLAPLSALVHTMKAAVFSQLDDYELALASARLAYSLDVTMLANYPVLGTALLETGEAEEAIGVLQNYLAFESEDALAWQSLGLSYQANGETLSSMAALDKALELDPGLAEAAYYRGLQYKSEGDNVNAVALLGRAVAEAPFWFDARVSLAQSLLATGDLDEAFFEINFSKNMIVNDEQLAAVYYWRATILTGLGQEDSALIDWNNLLELPEEAMPLEWRVLAEQEVGLQ
jgi:tetratricopeptide (TPR) repeat protein